MKVKARPKLLPIIAMILVAVLSLSTATYAWFSMNTKVTVTGMEVKTKVMGSLLIANTTMSQTAKESDDIFVSALTQVKKALLEPVSTVDGVNFYYTVDAKATGEKATAATIDPYIKFTGAAASDSSFYDQFSEVYGITKTDETAVTMYSANNGKAEPFVDYIFQIKATNSDTSDVLMKITQLKLTYTPSATEGDLEKAYRVAVFCEKYNSGFTAGVGNLVGIYSPSGAVNWDNKAVNGTATTASVTYNDATELDTVTANSTEYFKVVVRLYLEGADKTCNSETFMALTGKWALDLSIELDPDPTTAPAVQALEMAVATTTP